MKTHSPLTVTLALTGLLGFGLSTPAPAETPARMQDARVAPALPLPADVRLAAVRHSLLGTHTWYQQIHHGVPVQGGYYVVHDLGAAGVRVDDGRRTVNGPVEIGSARVAPQAVDVAVRHVPGRVVRRELVVLPESGLLAVRVDTDAGRQAFVDARTAGLIRVVSVLSRADGTGRVFDPNPLTFHDRQDIRDRRDKNQPILADAYRDVTLRRLGPSGRLAGKWARVTEANVGRAQSDTGTFVYTRSDEEFEQVSAYYGVDSIQAYLQFLGFTDVNAEAQDIHVNTTRADNSFYNPNTDVITFGTGGVDDAEDLEVVWHEYGHAMQDAQVIGTFGTSEQARAIGEGFGDYIAMAMSQRRDQVSGRERTTPYACIMDWDSTSYTTAPHCIRRTNSNLTMRDLGHWNSEHRNGQIWSRALYDINRALGVNRATRLIVEAQFRFAPDTRFKPAARATVATARALFAKPADIATVRQAFVDRRILRP